MARKKRLVTGADLSDGLDSTKMADTCVSARARAVKCPVCEGRGTIKNPDSTTTTEVPCHGCGGRGWVVVYDKEVKG